MAWSRTNRWSLGKSCSKVRACWWSYTARCVGHGEFQRNAAAKNEGGTESLRSCGYVRQDLPRARGFDRGGYGGGAEPVAAGERHGQLRESGATYPRKDRARPDSSGSGDSTTGHERRCHCGRGIKRKDRWSSNKRRDGKRDRRRNVQIHA